MPSRRKRAKRDAIEVPPEPQPSPKQAATQPPPEVPPEVSAEPDPEDPSQYDDAPEEKRSLLEALKKYADSEQDAHLSALSAVREAVRSELITALEKQQAAELQCKTLAGEIELEKQRYDKLTSQLADKQLRVDYLEAENQKLQAELFEADDKFTESDKTINHLKTQAEELASLKRQLPEYEAMHNALRKGREDFHALQMRLNAESVRCATLEAHLVKHETEHKELLELRPRLQSYVNDIDELRMTRAQNRQEIYKLLEMVQFYEHRVQMLKDKLDAANGLG